MAKALYTAPIRSIKVNYFIGISRKDMVISGIRWTLAKQQEIVPNLWFLPLLYKGVITSEKELWAYTYSSNLRKFNMPDRSSLRNYDTLAIHKKWQFSKSKENHHTSEAEGWSKAPNFPHAKHWYCLYSQFLHKKLCISCHIKYNQQRFINTKVKLPYEQREKV